LHEWSRALADFEHVLETEPGAIDAYLEAATALSQLERYSEALARAQQGVDLAPDTTAVLNQAARIAIEACVLGGASGKTACDAAQRFADRSLKIDGNQPEIIALRADACVVRE
jgi:tetratricopeptide (TPR) repeat protein